MPTTRPNLRLTSCWNHVLKTRRPPLSTNTNLLQPHPHPLATTANPEAIALARIDIDACVSQRAEQASRGFTRECAAASVLQLAARLLGGAADGGSVRSCAVCQLLRVCVSGMVLRG